MPDQGVAPQQKLITELKASAHLMLLDPGTFCIFHVPGGQAPNPRTGLPGVRLSLPPIQQQGRVRISTFQEDGWIGGVEGAALVRVEGGTAHVLVTVYQAPDGAQEPPRLQVMRLTEDLRQAGRREQPVATSAAPPAAPPAAAQRDKGGPVEIVAHVHGQGDLGGMLGDWIGQPGSKRWIEGFAIVPPGIPAGSIEYQAVLGRDWLSPWAQGGQFCGSRGMALPILGLRARLRGEAAETHDVSVTATFVDGSSNGPVEGSAGSQAESFAPLEAFRVELRPRKTVTSNAEPEVEAASVTKPLKREKPRVAAVPEAKSPSAASAAPSSPSGSRRPASTAAGSGRPGHGRRRAGPPGSAGRTGASIPAGSAATAWAAPTTTISVQ